MRRGIGGTGRERRERRSDGHEPFGEGQVIPERVHFLDVELNSGRRLQTHRFPQRLGGHERIAIAIAAYPGAHAQERWQCPRVIRETHAKQVFGVAVQTRELGEERAAEIVNAVLHLIDHAQPLAAHHARVPECEHNLLERLVALALLVGGERLAVTPVEHAGDLLQRKLRTLPLYFSGVRREHG